MRLALKKKLRKKYEAYVTTEILLEYEEKLRDFYGTEITEIIMQVFTLLPNVKHQEIYYNLNIITHDADDNKFVDCAFAANAHYIITNDKHFNVLKRIDFPTIPLLKIQEFANLLNL
jgi:putative PIN family toxin of toxin-antitoxin system